MLKQAEFLEKHGLVDLGYDIIILDDCYSEKQRNKKGEMVADPVKFPQGLQYLSGQVNEHGVSLAAYNDAGYYTCAGYPGSYGHEKQDLEVRLYLSAVLLDHCSPLSQTFASWGMKYLKVGQSSGFHPSHQAC